MEFRLKLEAGTLTEIAMLSMISLIYDPLGFAAPFILEGRRIYTWDSEVSSSVKKDWKNQVTKLRYIERLHVRRCIKPDNFGKMVNVSLHHFSDVSELGYGQCGYIEIVNEIRRVYCRLLLGKSRAVPKKFISIPRLELNAAVLSVKMACLLKKELKLEEVKEWFWTDSKVVTSYIKNDARRFKTFVANRVQQIRENTDVQQWCYVPNRENPADGASRSLNAAKVHFGSCWFRGPSFLWQNENSWPGVKGVEMEVLKDDPELRREAKSYAAIVHEDIIESLEEKISSWPRLKRIIGLV